MLNYGQGLRKDFPLNISRDDRPGKKRGKAHSEMKIKDNRPGSMDKSH